MIEWTTRPHYSSWLTVAEARLLEACQINALHKAGQAFGERLHAWHGNLLARVNVGHGSIPGGWNLAKRRYLERCVDLYGATLATAGIHVNLTLPEPLLAWDFMHRPATSARNGHLDSFKNRVYIDLTRRMRAFSALFIATSASTPLRVDQRHGKPIVRLSSFELDAQPDLPQPGGARPARAVSIVQGVPAPLVRSGAARRPFRQQQLDARPRPLLRRTGRAADLGQQRAARGPLSARPVCAGGRGLPGGDGATGRRAEPARPDRLADGARRAAHRRRRSSLRSGPGQPDAEGTAPAASLRRPILRAAGP